MSEKPKGQGNKISSQEPLLPSSPERNETPLERLERTVEELAHEVRNTLEIDYYDYDATISDYKRDQTKDSARKAYKFLKQFLDTLGIEQISRMKESLSESSKKKVELPIPDTEGYNDYEDVANAHEVLRNMRRMLALEKKVPGAVKFLYEQHGIRNFTKYNEAFWRRQYLERNNTEPYALFIVASSLESDASTSSAVLSDFQERLSKLDPPHLLRVIEVGTLSDLFRLTQRLNVAHNKQGENPIPLVVYDGHGTSRRLFLNNKNFGIDELEDPRFEDIFNRHFYNAFSENAEFVFGSCEAGLKEHTGYHKRPGVAETLKQTLTKLHSDKVRVIASEETATAFSELKPVKLKDGSLTLKIKSVPYFEGGTTRYRKM